MSALSSLGSTLAGPQQLAAAAIQNAVKGMNRDAAVVASGSMDVNDVLPALIDSRQQLIYTQAAAKMINTANEMLGTLIDVQA